MRLRNYSEKTIKSYKSCIRSFMQYFSKDNPRELTNENVRVYLTYLIENKKVGASTINQIHNALRFLYIELYKMPFMVSHIPRPKKERTLPDILDQEEVLRIFDKVNNLKHKAILILIYSAGLRIGEAVRLKIEDIDSKRMVIHIRPAKGKKDRYTLLSETTLKVLREYYKVYKPLEYLFVKAVMAGVI